MKTGFSLLFIISMLLAGCGKTDPSVNITETGGVWSTGCINTGASSSYRTIYTFTSVTLSMYNETFSSSGTCTGSAGITTTVEFSLILEGASSTLSQVQNMKATTLSSVTCSPSCVTSGASVNQIQLGIFKIDNGTSMYLKFGTASYSPAESSRPTSFSGSLLLYKQ